MQVGWMDWRGKFIMRGLVIFSLCVALTGCRRSVLPSDKKLVDSTVIDIRGVVVSNVPIGMSQANVENVLANSFHREWQLINYESPESISKKGFATPVSGGDYYLTSDIATVRKSFFSAMLSQSIFYLVRRIS